MLHLLEDLPPLLLLTYYVFCVKETVIPLSKSPTLTVRLRDTSMGVATCYINIFIASILDHACTAFYLYTRCIHTLYTHAVYRRHSVRTTKTSDRDGITCRLPYIPSNILPKISATSSSSAFSFVRDVLLRRSSVLRKIFSICSKTLQKRGLA